MSMQAPELAVFRAISRAYRITLLIYDDGGELLERFSPRPDSDTFLFAVSPSRDLLFKLCAQTKDPQIISSKTSQLWVGMQVPDADDVPGCLVIGPVYTSQLAKDLIVDYVRANRLPARQQERLSRAIQETPIIHYGDLTKLLAVLYAILHGEALDVSALAIVGLGEDRIGFPGELHHYQEDQAAREGAARPNYDFERYLLECIREGSIAKLKRHLRTATLDDVSVGRLSDPVRQQKDLFIIVMTLATRAAIQGGLNPDVAYAISELYVQRVELTNSVPAIIGLTRSMLYDYTLRVHNLRHVHRYSKSINDCCDYIDEHIREELRVTDIAAFVGFNPRYLSRKFKEETGQTISDYIRDAKISEAKSLLKYSDLSLSEISELLSFSSQSYFTYTFRQVTGTTPGRYRDTAEK